MSTAQKKTAAKKAPPKPAALSESLHAEIAALTCTPGLTFSKDIAPLFTATDIDHMKGVTGGQLDLSVCKDVQIYASIIYKKVSSGAMPPPGVGENPWTSAMVNTFGCWMQQGCPC